MNSLPEFVTEYCSDCEFNLWWHLDGESDTLLILLPSIIWQWHLLLTHAVLLSHLVNSSSCDPDHTVFVMCNQKCNFCMVHVINCVFVSVKWSVTVAVVIDYLAVVLLLSKLSVVWLSSGRLQLLMLFLHFSLNTTQQLTELSTLAYVVSLR